ncbi:MAG: NADH-quinone oxidoreductase subunit C [Acidobacteriota bacterium]
MPQRIGEPHFFAGEVTLPVEPAHLLPVCRFLRSDPACFFELLADLSGTDFPESEKRFQVVYHLASVRHTTRLRLRTAVAEGEKLDSVVSVWPGADWFEREVFDLLGVEFQGHPRLTRILMPDDWVGHPLRKDYPLPGFPEQHLRYRTADITRRSYVDISWNSAGAKAAAIVKKYGGRPPSTDLSPHVPKPSEPAPEGGSGGKGSSRET